MWRVYRSEWLVVHTSVSGEADCERVLAEEFEGRVRSEDWRIGSQPPGHAVLEVRLPNCRGEFRFAPDAVARAAEVAGQAVERGSTEEDRLLAYGTRRLRSS
jgi:hypothetical protein